MSLFEFFQKETELSVNQKHVFESSISAAFDNEIFLKYLYDVKKKKSCFMNGTIKLQNDRTSSPIEDIIYSRKSCRNFYKKTVDYNIFINILRVSYSLLENNRISVPSAGGIYPIKLIIVINDVELLPSGLYEYDSINFTLLPLIDNFSLEDYKKITSSYPLAENAAFSIHFLGDPRVTCYKYQDRGYRFLNIECGHIAQNLSLVAASNGVESICSGGGLDGDFFNYVSKETGIDYSPMLFLYEMFFGLREVQFDEK